MTDTNQASEDIRSKIETAQFDLAGRRATHIQVARRSGWTPSELDGVHEGDQIIFENDILTLIRTEKLKLLDEVRKRVVGEGDLVDAEILKKLYDRAYSRGYNDRCYENSYNSKDYRSAEDIAPVIAKIRGGYDKRFAALTKLEAEL